MKCETALQFTSFDVNPTANALCLTRLKTSQSGVYGKLWQIHLNFWHFDLPTMIITHITFKYNAHAFDLLGGPTIKTSNYFAVIFKCL